MANRNKRKNKAEIVVTTTTNDEMKKLIRVLVGVAIVFGLFFTITYFVTKKDEEPINTDTPATTIQYDEILVGQILNQNYNEYYVMVNQKDDPYTSLYSAYLSTYNEKENAIRVYTCDLGSVFNKGYVTDESKLNVSQIKDIRFNGSTLLKIKDKKIVAHYKTKDEIVKYLKEIIK